MTDSNSNEYHFVISSPRSGSTWLISALNHHPEILATENRLFGMFCEIWKNPNGRYAPRITVDQFIRGFATHAFSTGFGQLDPDEMQADFINGYIAFVRDFMRTRSNKPVIVDKVTPYLGTSQLVLEKSRSTFPDARYIHLVRDGRDVAVSGVFDWVAREKEDSDRYRLFVEKDTSIRLSRFFDDELLQRWASYWSEPIRAFEEATVQSHEVRYEAMLADQARSLESIFEFLGVDSDSSIAKNSANAVTFEKTTGRSSGNVNPLAKARKGVAGDWKNYFTRADARMFQDLTGDLLQRLNYERDTSWIDRCPVSLNLSID